MLHPGLSFRIIGCTERNQVPGLKDDLRNIGNYHFPQMFQHKRFFSEYKLIMCLIICFPECTGTSVLQVTATDADDPTYGNSARVVYSILQGQPYFSVDPKTG